MLLHIHRELKATAKTAKEISSFKKRFLAIKKKLIEFFRSYNYL